MDSAESPTQNHRLAPRAPCPVLIVEDDEDLRDMMAQMLSIEGFSAASVANGQEALTYLRGGGEASVILLDLRMPVMDGWAFRREQRADAGLAGIPIVILSGVEADRVHELDAAASFNKPVSFPEVVDVVRRLCETPRMGTSR